MDSTKPVCKYGSSCYRKNPDHLKHFSHPERDEPKGESSAAARGGKGHRYTTENQQSSPEKTIIGDLSPDVSDPSTTTCTIIDPPPKKRLKSDQEEISTKMNAQSCSPSSTTSVRQDSSEFSQESSDVKENIKRKFLVEMPDDFYQFWEFCDSINPTQPEAALKPFLDLELVGPYHVLAGRLTGVPWEKCVLHCRYYYDPPEFQTVLTRTQPNSDGFHMGYFRDDPNSAKCLVVSNRAKKSCEIAIEGSNLFSAVRNQIGEAMKNKGSSLHKNDKLPELSSKLTSFLDTRRIDRSDLIVRDIWRQRHKETVAKCFHKIGIVVPYDTKTELGYRPLTMSDRDLRKLLNKIASCKDESKREQLFEPLQEIVTYVQFANDECDYGMGLELGLDLFCHGDKHYHTLIEHLLPIAYDLLGREQLGKICLEHLKLRSEEPLDFTTQKHT